MKKKFTDILKERELANDQRNYEKKRSFILGVILFSLTIGVCMMCFGIYLFYVGYHNFDLGHNLNWINCDAKQDYVDYYNGQSTMNGRQLLILGANQMQAGLFFSMLGSAIFGYYLVVLTMRDHKNVYNGKNRI